MKKTMLALCAVTLLSAATGFAAVGDPAKDFTAKSLDGKEYKLSSYKDVKPVVLIFWQSACANCMSDMAFMSEQKAKYAGVEFLSVNVDTRSDDAWKTNIKGWLESKKVTLPVLLDPEYAVARSFGIGATPSTVMIGKDGKIANFFMGFNPGDEKALAEALGKLK